MLKSSDRKKVIACAVITLLALAWGPARADSAPEAAAITIRADTIQHRITYLASDALAGRGSGTPGNDQAARFIAAEFRAAGLKPIGTSRQMDLRAPMDGSGFFQPFSFVSGIARGSHNSLSATIGRRRVQYHAGTEFEPSGVSGSGSATGEVVFAGYGIEGKEAGRDDYAGMSVKGKIVLLIAGAPGSDPHSPLMEFAGIRRKALSARDRGALAVIVVLPNASDAPHTTQDDSPTDSGLPILVVRRAVAEEWLKSAGRSLSTIEAGEAGGGVAAAPLATGVTVSLTADVRKVLRTTANIAGVLEGSDPALQSEVVVIGAHMDHLGMGGPGSLAESKQPAIHHGADDNASGAAGVMALADYFAAQRTKPKRTLLFICFSGEELGLLGSMHYVKSPIIPLDRTVAMLNMDMIGRMVENKLIVVGSGTSPAWNALLDAANQEAGLTLTRNESGFGASDQQSFYASQIPVLFFFTGLHPDYHKPSDTADKINAAGEAKVVRLVADCAERIANEPSRPAYQQIAAADTGPTRSFRVSLGTIPDYSAEVEGVMLSGVRSGSAAEKAGLRKGDIIVKFGDRSIKNVQEYTIALSEHKPGDVVDIIVKRGSDMVTVSATLDAPKR